LVATSVTKSFKLNIKSGLVLKRNFNALWRMQKAKMKTVKLKANSLYLLPSGDVVKIIYIKPSTVIVHNYTLNKNVTMEVEFAEKIFQKIYSIYEVSKIIKRKSDTIRKQEYAGNILKARQIATGGKNTVRVYTQGEVEELQDFFGSRVRRKPAECATMHTPLQKRIAQINNKQGR
jgi:hypothetical protein